MTTEQIRKEITVYSWGIYDRGILIMYRYRQDIPKQLRLDPEESARQLSAIGSIDSWEAETFLLNYENQQLHWLAFIKTFKLSQYEAFTLAVRNEMEKELENDSNLLEMDKAIEALKH